MVDILSCSAHALTATKSKSPLTSPPSGPNLPAMNASRESNLLGINPSSEDNNVRYCTDKNPNSKTMARLCLFISLLLLAPAYAQLQVHTPLDTVETHIKALITLDTEALAKTYADKVVLKPGHEFLKDRYGLAAKGERSRAKSVDRKTLLAAMAKQAKETPRPSPPKDELKKLMEDLLIQSLAAKPGDFVTDSADPVDTPDRKLHFTIKDGDTFFKIQPPGEARDFILLQLRKGEDGTWRVVAEYLD